MEIENEGNTMARRDTRMAGMRVTARGGFGSKQRITVIDFNYGLEKRRGRPTRGILIERCFHSRYLL